MVKLLKARVARRPVDVLSTTLCAPLPDYMPGVRKGIVVDLPRRRLALAQHQALAAAAASGRLRHALIMPRTWKSALAPFLAGIPERTGFVGECALRPAQRPALRARRKLPRMVDRCAVLALPAGAAQPADWPLPGADVPAAEVAAGASGSA